MRLRGDSLFQFRKFVCLHFSSVCLQSFKNKKLLPHKHILALPTWGYNGLVSELYPFESRNFDLSYPVRYSAAPKNYVFFMEVKKNASEVHMDTLLQGKITFIGGASNRMFRQVFFFLKMFEIASLATVKSR